MTSSFRYPRQLLHSYTEPQWLPPAENQKTSSLDRLEEEEQWQIERLKKLVLPENIPAPIGMDDSKKFALNAQQSGAGAESDATLLGSTTVSQQLSFWDRHYQSVVNGTVGSQTNTPTQASATTSPDAAAAATSSKHTSADNPAPTLSDKRASLGGQRDRSLATTSITMSAYKKRNIGRKRMAPGSHTTGKSSSEAGIVPGTSFPTPRGADTNDSQMLLESNSSFAVSSQGNISSSMMSMSGSQDDTTFDDQYGDEDDEDDEEMEG